MPDDNITDLRGHIDAAHAAADRLVREATERAKSADEAFRERLADVPERGWDVPPDAKGSETPSELAAIVALLGGLRDAIPNELSAQVAEAVRELLLAVRALIDWYLTQLEELPRRTGSSPPDDDRVQDIPIS